MTSIADLVLHRADDEHAIASDRSAFDYHGQAGKPRAYLDLFGAIRGRHGHPSSAAYAAGELVHQRSDRRQQNAAQDRERYGRPERDRIAGEKHRVKRTGEEADGGTSERAHLCQAMPSRDARQAGGEKEHRGQVEHQEERDASRNPEDFPLVPVRGIHLVRGEEREVRAVEKTSSAHG